jgi:hypothetical protein
MFVAALSVHSARRLFSKRILCALLLLYTLALSQVAAAHISVDGEINESEWQNAQHCDGWQRTEPFVHDSPRYGNDALFVATADGLAVALIFDQPPDERRIRPRSPHDAPTLPGDYASVVVDFDATGQVGYEFAVGLGGGTRDGLVTNQTYFDRDWDGEWWHAVRETKDRWTVEMLIPWTSINMKDSNAETRTIGVYASRYLAARNERYACPGIVTDSSVFLGALEHIQVEQHRAVGTLDIVPYASALSDFVNDSSQVRGGLDVNWKPTPHFALAATVNPDFGQVEGDELVVNFSAIETVFTDRRPFFTENLGVFDLRTPSDGQLIYTRRIGGPSDDGRDAAADIDAAVKFTGTAGSWIYGAFAAQEDQYSEDVGRRFAATRIALPADRFRIGYLGTWTERPYFDRTALVNAVDYEFSASDQFRLSGQFIRSDIKEQEDSDGYESWLQADLGTGTLNHSLKLLHIDDDFDLNDLGYMERNSLEQIEWQTQRRIPGAPGSRVSGVTQTFAGYYRENGAGEQLPARVQFIRDARYRNAWSSYIDGRVYSRGIDDLISRGHGPLEQDPRVGLYFDVTSPRLGDFSYVFGGYLFQEGVSGYSGRLEFVTTWYPSEQLSLNVDLRPYYEGDWLLWDHENVFGSYRAWRLDYAFRLDWVPAQRHELRIKWEWIGIDAQLRSSYQTLPSGKLVRSADELSDFTVNSLGFQIRYHYKLGPLSDLYLVYGRGGFLVDEDDRRDVEGLFEHMVDVRDADQFLIKFRYRL